MGTKSGQEGKGLIVQAVVRRFPTSEFAIRKLINQSDTFCDICGELVDCELALSKVRYVCYGPHISHRRVFSIDPKQTSPLSEAD